MTKLLFIGSFPQQSQGGTSTASISLKKALEEIGITVFTIDSTIRDIANNRLADRIKRAWNRRSEIRNTLRIYKPSHALIFCGHGLSFIEKSWWLMQFNKRNIKTILAPRSGLILKSVKQSFFKKILSRTIKKADHVLCQGKYWLNFYAAFDKSNPSKFVELHNWIELPQKTENLDKTKTQAPLSIAVVGWLNDDKGLLDLIPISLNLKQEIGSNFEIIIYGKGPIKNLLEQTIKENDLDEVIKIQPWINQKELWNKLETSSLLLFLSRYEGMPNAIMESFACGLPVLAYKTSTIPELVSDGKNGYLFEYDDYNGIAERLLISTGGSGPTSVI